MVYDGLVYVNTYVVFFHPRGWPEDTGRVVASQCQRGGMLSGLPAACLATGRYASSRSGDRRGSIHWEALRKSLVFGEMSTLLLQSTLA